MRFWFVVICNHSVHNAISIFCGDGREIYVAMYLMGTEIHLHLQVCRMQKLAKNFYRYMLSSGGDISGGDSGDTSLCFFVPAIVSPRAQCAM